MVRLLSTIRLSNISPIATYNLPVLSVEFRLGKRHRKSNMTNIPETQNPNSRIEREILFSIRQPIRMQYNEIERKHKEIKT